MHLNVLLGSIRNPKEQLLTHTLSSFNNPDAHTPQLVELTEQVLQVASHDSHLFEESENWPVGHEEMHVNS